MAVKGTDTLEFAYDYMGRRVEKKVYSGADLTSHTRFVYDGYKLIEELDALNSNASLRRYTWQDEEVGLDVPLTVYDVASEATYFYHTDANKNVTELTDISGNVVAHYEYSPFGKVVASSGAYSNSNPFRFSSEYHDDETGLVYYNYRYYSPDLGRWLSRDPVAERGGYNLYGMVGNNTVGNWDSLGLIRCPQCGVENCKIHGCGDGSDIVKSPSGPPARGVPTQTNVVKDPCPTAGATGNVKVKAKDRRAAEQQEAKDKKGYDPNEKGTPGNNQAQNKQTQDVGTALGLDKAQQRTLHDAVSGQNYDFHQMKDIGERIKNGTW